MFQWGIVLYKGMRCIQRIYLKKIVFFWSVFYCSAKTHMSVSELLKYEPKTMSEVTRFGAKSVLRYSLSTKNRLSTSYQAVG